MKKEYICPESEVVNFKVEGMIASSIVYDSSNPADDIQWVSGKHPIWG